MTQYSVGYLGARTVGALGGGVEEEEGLVNDTSAGASSGDKATHNAGGAARHEGHHAVCGSAAGLHPDEPCQTAARGHVRALCMMQRSSLLWHLGWRISKVVIT